MEVILSLACVSCSIDHIFLRRRHLVGLAAIFLAAMLFKACVFEQVVGAVACL